MPITEKDNKILYGLRNVHVAEQTETVDSTTGNVTYTYGTPVAIPGAVNFSADPEGEDSPFYADDIVYYRTTSNNGYSGDLEMALIPDWFLEKYLAYEKDTKGVLYEKATGAEPPKFALLFEFQGDVKAVRRVIYNCSVSRPSQAGATKESSISPSTATLSYAADPRKDGVVMGKTTAETDAATYSSWYQTVAQPVATTGA